MVAERHHQIKWHRLVCDVVAAARWIWRRMMVWWVENLTRDVQIISQFSIFYCWNSHARYQFNNSCVCVCGFFIWLCNGALFKVRDVDFFLCVLIGWKNSILRWKRIAFKLNSNLYQKITCLRPKSEFNIIKKIKNQSSRCVRGTLPAQQSRMRIFPM